MSQSAPAVLVIAGMAKEAKLIDAPGVTTLISGGSVQQLQQLLGAYQGPVRAVISFGVAGGLDPALEPGDLIIADKVTAEMSFDADPRLVAHYAKALAGLKARVGTLAGSDEAVTSPRAKRELYASGQALAVDMESHLAAAFAAKRNVPFVAIRAVCDPAGRTLPAFVRYALKPDGTVAIPTVIGSLLTGAMSLRELLRLGQDSRAAFATLCHACATLGPGLGVAQLRNLLGDVA